MLYSVWKVGSKTAEWLSMEWEAGEQAGVEGQVTELESIKPTAALQVICTDLFYLFIFSKLANSKITAWCEDCIQSMQVY